MKFIFLFSLQFLSRLLVTCIFHCGKTDGVRDDELVPASPPNNFCVKAMDIYGPLKKLQDTLQRTNRMIFSL